MKKLLLTSAIASLLSACGGDSVDTVGNDDTTNTTSQRSKYRALDGYLGGALVYADADGDMVADDDEYIGKTAADGTIDIDQKHTNYDIIVRAIANVTTDSDINGTVSESKEMIAKSGVRHITPLSTLAAIQNLTLNDLAADLGINPDEIDADFIANDYKNTHVLNRSINTLLYDNLKDTKQGKVAIKENAKKLVEHLQQYSYSNAELDDLVLTIENGSIITTTPDQLHNGSYDISTLDLAWEQKDFSVVTYTSDLSEQGFHPCYVREASDKSLIVTNCFSNKFIILDGSTGDIKAQSEQFGDMEITDWYLDREFVALIDSNDTTIYLDKNLQRANPDASELDYADAKVITTQRNVIYRGSDSEIANRLANANWLSYRNVRARSGEFSHYESDGAYYVYDKNGIETKYNTASEAELKSHILEFHNASGTGHTTVLEEINVDWITDDVFISSVNLDSNRVSNDYYYLTNRIGTFALGRMYGGSFQIGLDKHSVVYYSAYKGPGNENHVFKQFDMRTGQLINTWNATMTDYPANFYARLHTKSGITIVSDSYSTVLRLVTSK
ncbi:hypothetical protein VTH8203_01367 [Vibrio thalassae]|uniref:Lipoprotein n=1 Tax=Vibrio thalassae TaxID=1243014 RepID=A0A240EGG1_9VIBR|nr:hypothetical protein [Vibrio thalassae]SNX47752.1 hypothetical protein VTH8203_01367 [Vibrio thalassae]